MITPSKTIPFKDSIAHKMTCILSIEFQEIKLVDLYNNTKNKFSGIEEFIYSLDALYVLGKIDIDSDMGMIRKC